MVIFKNHINWKKLSQRKSKRKVKKAAKRATEKAVVKTAIKKTGHPKKLKRKGQYIN